MHRLVLFMANKEGSLAMLDIERGEHMGPAKSPWVAPKNTSAALAMALLDAEGAPAAPLAGQCPLAWANNSAAAAPTAAHAPITMPGGFLQLTACLSHVRVCMSPVTADAIQCRYPGPQLKSALQSPLSLVSRITMITIISPLLSTANVICRSLQPCGFRRPDFTTPFNSLDLLSCQPPVAVCGQGLPIGPCQ
jgi:hypothetical protein